MNLSNFYKKDEVILYSTDKGYNHDYIDSYYNQEFSNKRYENIKILEIGLAWGGSAKLWRDWFINGEIYIIENDENLIQNCPANANIFLGDAYSFETIEHFNNIKFDYIIDDGPHTISSQLFCLEYWISKIKDDGKIIIEDIQDIEYSNDFKKLIFEKKMNVNFKIFDFRDNKKQHDDIIFEISKK